LHKQIYKYIFNKSAQLAHFLGHLKKKNHSILLLLHLLPSKTARKPRMPRNGTILWNQLSRN